MDKSFNILAILSVAILGVMSTFTGATYAYYTAVTEGGAGNISGSTYSFNANIDITPIVSGELIPLKDNLLTTALSQSNVCIDKDGYNACSLYKLTLTNSGSVQTLTGYLTTLSGTTFSSGDLKYKLLTKNGNTYTDVSSVGSISTSAPNYFKSGSNNLSITLSDGTTNVYSTDYYLVIWLSDNNNDQPLTQNKSLIGNVTFTSTTGDKIYVGFNT